MSQGKMPPQAYTRETLQEAFEWWSEQPDELRSKVQDKDDLVGYYLRLQRGGAKNSSEGFTRAAKESFSSELKGLAKDLETFEGYAKGGPSAGLQGSRTKKEERSKGSLFAPSTQLDFPLSKVLVPAKNDENGQASAQSPIEKPTVKEVAKISEGSFFKLDEKSRSSVKLAKEALNLSSDEEALRALVALGTSKLKTLF